MTKSRSTKNALISSILVLALCFSMLLGTTFAWFTDTAASNDNKVVSGTLDVELWKHTGTGEGDKVNISDSHEALFTDDILWEPNRTEVVYLSIRNNGSLALKYKVAIDVTVDSDVDLTEVMEYDIIENAQYGSVTAWADEGTSVVPGTNATQANDVELLPEAVHYFALAVHMDKDAGNKYQGQSISFDIKVLAGQAAHEEGAFGGDYDADATYPDIDTVTVPENNTEEVVLSTESINVTIPASDAEDGAVYKIEVSNESTETDVVTGETTVGFDLTMYKNDVKVSGDTIYEVTKNIGAGLFISEVTHNGIALAEADTGADQTYTYDSTTGVLTIYTKSFSPFAVTYKDYVDYVRNKNFFYGGYISVSTGADLLPIVSIMPEITKYSVFDGDTRITDSVTFRFSEIKKETIDENSYKVSLNLAIKDDKGNDLELKPGMPSTINGKEYLHVFMNLIEVPDGYSVSNVKVNDTALTETDSGNPATGEYWIGSDGTGVYLQSMEAGLIEVILTKAN